MYECALVCRQECAMCSFFEGVLELIGIHKRIRALNFPYDVLMCIVKCVGVCARDVCVSPYKEGCPLF